MSDVPYLDEWLDRGSEDWNKTRTWDLPDDAEAFVLFLYQQDKSLTKAWAKFKKLPAYRAMPPKLSREVSAEIIKVSKMAMEGGSDAG